MFDAHRDQLRALCLTYGVRRLEVFGSVARGEDRPGAGDVDLLVDFGDQPVVGAFKRYMGLKADLEALLGRPVDLVEPVALTNPYLRKAIDRDRRELYAA
jgi:predicted nucleotidyltransferase